MIRRKSPKWGSPFFMASLQKVFWGCAIAFPAHGDTTVDPHIDLPRFDVTAERLARHELLPFAAAVAAGVPTVMTAHILLPQLDTERPASLSSRVLGGILRSQWKFEGVILADDLGMGAIAKRFAPGAERGENSRGRNRYRDAMPRQLRRARNARRRGRIQQAGRFEPEQWSAGRKSESLDCVTVFVLFSPRRCRRWRSSAAPRIARSPKRFASAGLTFENRAVR